MWCKHTNYEQATRIPLIVVAPGVTRPGSRTRALIETVDLYPTLVELAGLSTAGVTQKLDGLSQVPVLRRPGRRVKDVVFHAYPRSPAGRGPLIGRAVRDARFRLVEWKKAGAPANTADTADLELYDYRGDPLETRNLAGERPGIVARLRSRLAREPEARPQVTGSTGSK